MDEKDKELQKALEALDIESKDVKFTTLVITKNAIKRWDDDYKNYKHLAVNVSNAAAILAHIESLKAEIKMLKGANAAWQKENKRLAEIETQAAEDTEIMRHQQQRIDELEQRQRILWKEG